MLNYVIFALHEALIKLDGYVKGGQLVPYDFEPLANRAISKNLRLLSGPVSDLRDSRRRMVRAVLPPGVTSVTLDRNDPRVQKMEAEWITMLNEDVPIDLMCVAESLFKFDVNPVPLAVQKALAPILIDVPSPNFPPLAAPRNTELVQDDAQGCASSRCDSAQ